MVCAAATGADGPAHAQQSIPLNLTGHAAQGGLVIGRTAPGARVILIVNRKFWWEKTRKLIRDPIPVSADGIFVFGLGREAPATAQLLIRQAGKAPLTRTLRIRQRRFRVQRIDGVARKYVTPPKHLKARLKREFLMVVNARKTFSAGRGFLQQFIWPAQGRISGVYGSQRVYNGKARAPHFGLDIAAARGTSVRAPADGVVLLTHHLYFAGKTVLLDHGRGVTTTYIHLSRIRVKAGQRVRQGHHIGDVGTTGRSTGPHLHWAMSWRQIRLDPALMLPGPAPGRHRQSERPAVRKKVP